MLCQAIPKRDSKYLTHTNILTYHNNPGKHGQLNSHFKTEEFSLVRLAPQAHGLEEVELGKHLAAHMLILCYQLPVGVMDFVLSVNRCLVLSNISALFTISTVCVHMPPLESANVISTSSDEA